MCHVRKRARVGGTGHQDLRTSGPQDLRTSGPVLTSHGAADSGAAEQGHGQRGLFRRASREGPFSVSYVRQVCWGSVRRVFRFSYFLFVFPQGSSGLAGPGLSQCRSAADPARARATRSSINLCRLDDQLPGEPQPALCCQLPPALLPPPPPLSSAQPLSPMPGRDGTA